MTRIELDDGKYTVVHDSGAGLHALRYGEHWRDMTGDGLVLAMAQEIEDLRRRIVPVQQVSAQDKFCIGAWRDALEKIAKYAPQVNCAARTELERAGLIAVHALIAFSAPQLRPARGTQTASNAAQAAPAADAGHVFYGMDGNHP